MAIKLNIVKPTTQVEESVKQGYLYKDISLDLNPYYTERSELFASSDINDLQPLYDISAIITSLKNILTTSPGEKILNPLFGLDLRDYLFESISETKGYFLGEDIVRGLPGQESRIKLNFVEVIVDREEQQYDINLNISVPSLNVYGLTIFGVLNNDGYTFV